MKIRLLNTISGLVPLYDADFDEKRKLKIGEQYEAEIRLIRNPQFHRKFMALINCAWENLPEQRRQGFRTCENLRKYLIVAAGYCEVFYSPKVGDWVEIPKSIAFDKMDDAEFQDLYLSVRCVIDSILAPTMSPEKFSQQLLNF